MRVEELTVIIVFALIAVKIKYASSCSCSTLYDKMNALNQYRWLTGSLGIFIAWHNSPNELEIFQTCVLPYIPQNMQRHGSSDDFHCIDC